MLYQLVIEPSVFARESKTLQGNLPIADLPRVLDALAEAGGAINYWIDGHISERERPQLFLRLNGVFSLRIILRHKDNIQRIKQKKENLIPWGLNITHQNPEAKK